MDIDRLFLLNPTLVVGNKILPLASGDIHFESVAQGDELQLQIRSDLVDQLVNAWLEIVHSLRPIDVSRPSFDLVQSYSNDSERDMPPSNTAITGVEATFESVYGSHSDGLNPIDTAKFSSVYGASNVYGVASEEKLASQESLGETLVRPRQNNEGEAIAVSGDQENGKRILATLRGVVGLNVSLEVPSSDIGIVTWKFNSELPLSDKIWLIES